MSAAAKEMHRRFHIAMNTRDVVPFEHLSVREMEAWREVAADDLVWRLRETVSENDHEIRSLQEEVRAAEDDACEAKEELAKANRQIGQLETEIESLKAQINEFDAGLQKTQPESKPTKKGGKR